MNQNSWPVQVYCFARHTHREHGIPSPPPPTPLTPPHRFPLPDSHASWLQTDFPGRSWKWYWLILGFLIPLRGLFKPSLFLLVHTKINTIFKRGPFPFSRRLQNSWHHFAKPARVTASERASERELKLVVSSLSNKSDTHNDSLCTDVSLYIQASILNSFYRSFDDGYVSNVSFVIFPNLNKVESWSWVFARQ